MEMYQEPPPAENPLEDPDSPMEDMPPLEPEPFIPYVSGTHYLWVVRLDNGMKLKVTDPKEQQGDVEEEEAEGEQGGNQVDC